MVGYFPLIIFLISCFIAALRELLIDSLNFFNIESDNLCTWRTYLVSVISVMTVMCLSSFCSWIYSRITRSMPIYSARNMERIRDGFSISCFTFFLVVLIGFKVEIALTNSHNDLIREEQDISYSIISILLTAIVIIGVWPIIKMLFKFALRKKFKMRM